jgi:hypothetical protein
LKKPEDEPTPAGLHHYTEGGNGADGSPNGHRSSNGDVPARSADAEGAETGADGADGAESRSTAIPS